MQGRVVNGKTHPTIGACGIDCGLCPMHHVKAGDGCGGCTSPGPSGAAGRWCAISRCAVRDRGYETCAECAEFPCSRLEGWDRGDSIVSHLRAITNLRAIRERGMEAFDAQQKTRMKLLGVMLDEFDEGRSKSYCCAATALLPVDELTTGLAQARRDVEADGIPADDRKSRARILRRVLDAAAERLGISLKLRRG